MIIENTPATIITEDGQEIEAIIVSTITLSEDEYQKVKNAAKKHRDTIYGSK